MPARQAYPLTLINGQRYLAVRAIALRAEETPLPARAASQLINRALLMPKDLNQLAALEQGIYPQGVRSYTLRHARVLPVAFQSGAWVLIRAASGGAPPPQEKTESVADQLRLAKIVKTWVEMEVVNELGEPVSGHPYICMLPDGTIRDGTLDKKGRVRFDGIDPGNCAFSLTSLSPDSWRRA